jgi:zinc protease
MRQAALVLCIAGLCGSAAGEPGFPIHRETLDNGLDVVIAEEHSSPIVNVQMWYRVGSKNEPENRQGYAPLARQILRHGPTVLQEQTPEGLFRLFSGLTDSRVSFDNTVFWSTLPANQLEVGLWLEAERIAHPNLDSHLFDQERQRLIDDRRARIDARPFGDVYEVICRTLFGDRPYGHIPVANVEQLQSAEADDFATFLKQAYAPNNATVIIYGAVQAADALELVKNTLGTLPRQPDLPAVSTQYPVPNEPQRVVREADVPVPFVAMLHLLPGAANEDMTAVRVLERVLAAGPGAPLYDRLVTESELAYQAATLMLPNQDAGVLGVGVICREKVKPEDVEAIMNEELRKIIETGVSAEQLDKARVQSLAYLVSSRQTMAGMGERLGFGTVALNRPPWVFEEWDQISRVTAEDVHRVARKYLDPAHRVTLVLAKAEPPQPPVVPSTVKPGAQPAEQPQAQPQTQSPHEHNEGGQP